MNPHDRPARRPAPIPPELIAQRLDIVAAEYEARARWFRERAALWRQNATPGRAA